MKDICVVNASHPEVNNIAAALDSAGLLKCYYRPYVNKGRFFDYALSNFAGGRSANRSLKGIDVYKVIEVGLGEDLLWMLGNAVKKKMIVKQVVLDALMHRRTVAVGRQAASRIQKTDVIIADIGTALEGFKKFPRSFKILNYPIARHSFARAYLAEASKRAGEFSSTLDITNYPDWVEDRFEHEVELADLILVGSSFVKESFVSTGVAPHKIAVIPYGFDDTVFAPKQEYSSIGPLKLLFVGTVGERKGISYLNDAFKQLREANVELTIVGGVIGGTKTLSSIDRAINYIPHTNHSELKQLYLSHDVFVFPSLIEGMPLVVLEAMASGMPIIATPNGPGDLIRDGLDGYIIEPQSSTAIVKAVENFVQDRLLVSTFGRSAALRAQDFTWERYQSNVLKLIESL